MHAFLSLLAGTKSVPNAQEALSGTHFQPRCFIAQTTPLWSTNTGNWTKYWIIALLSKCYDVYVL